ncbi:actin, plasmodial isoform-like [Diadema antillarum]|uniref:actin, plasmodial isoform-like n=1 Tax=Diadema antillarum TaxID=105358 RepID=UPI003A84FD67
MADPVDGFDFPAVVIDNGSGTCRVGFAGEDHCVAVFSSVVGKPLSMVPLSRGEYIGDHAQRKRDLLSIRYPIEHGIVADWDGMEKVWSYALSNKLHASPDLNPILMSEAPLNPKANREKMAQVMFEKFNATAFYVANQAVLSHFSSGTTSLLVVDIGDGVIDVMPIYQSHIIRRGVQRVDFGGRNLTDYLMRLLSNQGYSFTTTADRELLREIKEKFGAVAMDYEHQTLSDKCSPIFYEYGDDQFIKLGRERYQVAEPLFRPSLLGLPSPGIHELIYDSIMKSDVDCRKDLYKYIYLSGGSTLFEGFADRLRKELAELAPAAVNITVKPADDRDAAVWIGGSIMASIARMEGMWVRREEYEEYGPNIVHQKCVN